MERPDPQFGRRRGIKKKDCRTRPSERLAGFHRGGGARSRTRKKSLTYPGAEDREGDPSFPRKTANKAAGEKALGLGGKKEKAPNWRQQARKTRRGSASRKGKKKKKRGVGQVCPGEQLRVSKKTGNDQPRDRPSK